MLPILLLAGSVRAQQHELLLLSMMGTGLLGFQADRVADGAADALTALRRHALGHGHSADAPRLRAQYAAALAQCCRSGPDQGRCEDFKVFQVKGGHHSL